MISASFHMLISDSISFWWWANSDLQFLLSCFLLLSFKYLYFLDLHLLADIRFTNIFTKSVSCLFVLFKISFTDQKLRHSLICFYVLYVNHTSEIISKNLWSKQSHVDFLLFSSRGVFSITLYTYGEL